MIIWSRPGWNGGPSQEHSTSLTAAADAATMLARTIAWRDFFMIVVIAVVNNRSNNDDDVVLLRRLDQHISTQYTAT